MASTGKLVSGVGGAAGELFGGISSYFANDEKASGYKKAANQADQQAQYAAMSTRLQIAAQERKQLLTVGGQQADVAGAGFTAGGSALDLLRASASQGALSKQVIGMQGAITEEGYHAQADAYRGQADAAKKAGEGDLFGSILKTVGTVAAFLI